MGIILFSLKKRIIYVCSHRKKKRTTKILEFFFFLVSLLLLSISISLVSESKFKGHYLWYIYLDFFKSKKSRLYSFGPIWAFTIWVAFEIHTYRNGRKKNHTHTNCYSVIALLRRRINIANNFFFHDRPQKKKIRVQSNLFFVLIFFPWKPTQPPFLVPVHPLKKN